MNIVPQNYDYIAGVDTHAKKHVLVLVDRNHIKVGNALEIRVTKPQMLKSIDKVSKITGGNVLFAVEGTSSYGETFCKLIKEAGFDVIEVKAIKNKDRKNGKSDEIDAQEAALTALRTPHKSN